MDKVFFLSNGLFILGLYSSFSYVACDNTIDSMNLHARSWHISGKRMIRLANEGFLGSLANVSIPMSDSCQVGNAYRKPFRKALRPSYSL